MLFILEPDACSVKILLKSDQQLLPNFGHRHTERQLTQVITLPASVGGLLENGWFPMVTPAKIDYYYKHKVLFPANLQKCHWQTLFRQHRQHSKHFYQNVTGKLFFAGIASIKPVFFRNAAGKLFFASIASIKNSFVKISLANSFSPASPALNHFFSAMPLANSYSPASPALKTFL